MSSWTPMDVPPAGTEQDHDAPTSPSPAGGGADGGRPTDVGLAAGAPLRASNTDRDQVAALLSAAYAEGRLTHQEHDERLEQVLGARTFDDLVRLTADLVPFDPVPATVSAPGPAPVVGNGASTEPDRMVAVFGGVDRRGRWQVRARSRVIAVFGGVDLDLREADFDAPVVEIDVQTCFGGVEIKVPAGVTVRSETVNIFGGTDVKNLGEPVEGAPTLVIKGYVLFGGVDVKGPKPRRWFGGGAR